MKRYPAPAKINLHLKITRTLDNGYHELDTSFIYVDVADMLEVSPSNSLNVSCSKKKLDGENNLVYQVLHALQKQYGVSEGLSIHINKKLPDQAGLGGGSSDAATALLIANNYWRLGLSIESLIAFATPFGADIPCFLFGEASLATGIGEKLTPYPENIPNEHLLLAYPGLGLSTPEVFHCYDQQVNKARALTHHGGIDTIRDHSKTAIGNNELESYACSLSTAVNNLLREMKKVSDKAWMSGSGSTCVALFANKHEADNVARMLQAEKLANWTHVGKLLKKHPLQSMKIGA